VAEWVEGGARPHTATHRDSNVQDFAARRHQWDAILIGKSGEPVPASDFWPGSPQIVGTLGTITMTERGTCTFDLRMREKQKVSSAAGRRASARPGQGAPQQ